MKRTFQPLLLFATAFACWSSAHSAEVVLAKYELPAELTGLPTSIPIVIDVNLAAAKTNPIPEKADPIGLLMPFPYDDAPAVDALLDSYRAEPDSWHGQALRVAAAGFGIRGDYPMFRETALRLYREDTNRLDSAVLAVKSLVVRPETREEARSLVLSNLERWPGEPSLLWLLSYCDLADKDPARCGETTARLLDAVESDPALLGQHVLTHVLLAATLGDGAEFETTAGRLAKVLKETPDDGLNTPSRYLLFLYGSVLRHYAESRKDADSDLPETAACFLSRGLDPFARNGSETNKERKE